MRSWSMVVTLLAVVPVGVRGQEEREDEVRRRLETTPFTFQGGDVPILDVVQVLRDTGRIEIVVDPGIGHEDDLKIDIACRDLTVAQTLDLLCDFYPLSWTIEHGVVRIRDSSARPSLETRSFPVQEVLERLLPDPFPGEAVETGRRYAPLDLHDLLQGADEEAWDEEGALLLVTPDVAIATSRPAVLDRVADLLDRLRRRLSIEHRLQVALVESDPGSEGPADAPAVGVPFGQSVRVSRADWQLAPGPAGHVRLSVATPLDPEQPGFGIATEVVVPVGRWVELAGTLRDGKWTRLVARVESAGAPAEEPVAADPAFARLDSIRVEILEFDRHPLDEVVEFLRDNYEIEMMVDPLVYEEFIEEELQVTLAVSDLSLRDALALILEPHRLALDHAHGVWIVRTADRRPRVLRLHDLRHIVPCGDYWTTGFDRGILPLETLTTNGRTLLSYGGPFMAGFVPEEDHALALGLARRLAAATPRTIRAELRTGDEGAFLLVASGHTSRFRPATGGWTSIRPVLDSEGRASVTIEDASGSHVGQAEVGSWSELLPGKTSVRLLLED